MELRLAREPIAGGIVPVRKLSDKSSTWSSRKAAMEVGMVPERPVLAKLMVCKSVQPEKEAGKEALKSGLLAMLKLMQERRVRSEAIPPEKLLSSR